MSIPDAVLPMYLQYATAWPPEEIDAATAGLASGELHPNAAKRRLARAVVDLYHGAGAGDAAEAEFDQVFKRHEPPSTMPEVRLAAPGAISAALKEAGLAPSVREARRVIAQGAVRIDGEPVAEDGTFPPGEHVVQVGRKRWARIHGAAV
jgi:tyrosyl-tRNA synthetase